MSIFDDYKVMVPIPALSDKFFDSKVKKSDTQVTPTDESTPDPYEKENKLLKDMMKSVKEEQEYGPHE